MATCYRHPSRETGVSCSSCGRPICPDCMTPTSVGMRCPECAGKRTRVKTVRSLQRSEPRATYFLIIVNVVLFIASTGEGGGLVTTASNTSLLTDLGLSAPAVDLQHHYYVLVTSGFMHVNLIHIGFNMYLLYLMGQMLEPVFGPVRFAAVYFTAMLTGALGALLLSPNSLTVGASGAVFGLFGAAFVEQRKRGINPMQTGLGALIILNLLISVAIPGISIGDHVGGLIGGVLAAGALELGNRRRSLAIALAACVAISAAAVAGSLAAAHIGLPSGLGG